MEKSRSVPDHCSSSYYSFDSEDRNKSYNFNGPRSSRSQDAEHKRKKRLASYNVFTMEAKLKSSVRNSFKWIKSRMCKSQGILHQTSDQENFVGSDV